MKLFLSLAVVKFEVVAAVILVIDRKFEELSKYVDTEGFKYSDIEGNLNAPSDGIQRAR